jgi:hypothetical protein
MTFVMEGPFVLPEISLCIIISSNHRIFFSALVPQNKYVVKSIHALYCKIVWLGLGHALFLHGLSAPARAIGCYIRWLSPSLVNVPLMSM